MQLFISFQSLTASKCIIMIPYKNISWKSNIAFYQYDETSITIEFKSWKERTYLYTYASAWFTHIEKMKKLADLWEGLNSYISTEKPDYHSKK